MPLSIFYLICKVMVIIKINIKQFLFHTGITAAFLHKPSVAFIERKGGNQTSSCIHRKKRGKSEAQPLTGNSTIDQSC